MEKYDVRRTWRIRIFQTIYSAFAAQQNISGTVNFNRRCISFSSCERQPRRVDQQNVLAICLDFDFLG